MATIIALGGTAPRIAADVFLAPTAVIIGDVEIGEGSSVWFGAVLRGDSGPIRIGRRTNLQDGVIVHLDPGLPTTIGDDVTVGHGAIVHGCKVGDRSLIGMGSIVLDGAVIEEECLVAAGALVPPGMRVKARSLVMGSPGKLVKVLGEADLATIREAADLYVQYAKSFAQSLAELQT